MIYYKKAEKQLYLPKTTPSIIDVPQMTFITVEGMGDPNTSAEYGSGCVIMGFPIR